MCSYLLLWHLCANLDLREADQFCFAISNEGYRDHSDGPYRLAILPFSSDNADEFKAFVSSQVSFGGADIPEGAILLNNIPTDIYLWELPLSSFDQTCMED